MDTHARTRHAKTGIVFYSRSGYSKRVAQRLADMLNGTLIEIDAPAYKRPILGYLHAGFDSVRQVCKLPPQTFTPLSDYDRVILCGPVWTSYPATPLRALLRSDPSLPDAVALCLTSGGHSHFQAAVDAGTADLGRAFSAVASFPNEFEGTETEHRILERFINDLGNAERSMIAN
ncbi:flavodoxin family protein [Litoreibacter roseus]|nr:hypothetical protein [Litoreibacter roseus]